MTMPPFNQRNLRVFQDNELIANFLKLFQPNFFNLFISF